MTTWKINFYSLSVQIGKYYAKSYNIILLD